MAQVNLLKDMLFLYKLINNHTQNGYVRVIILDKLEHPIRSIEGRVSSGSLSIVGNSAVRRAGNINFLAESANNDLSDLDNLLSMNKRIKILIGIENNIDNRYDKIIWFNQGIFVITNPALNHNLEGVTISLQFKDKMCLLNGECGGTLPTVVTFHEYDQIMGYDEINYSGALESALPLNPNNYTVYGLKKDTIQYFTWDGMVWNPASKDMIGSVITLPQKVFDIIQTLVCNYGGEDISNIIINDIPQEIKNIVRYIGTGTLYYNTQTSVYTRNEQETIAQPQNWRAFSYNDDCGYVYTDFIYPGQLVSSIGENVASILEKIANTLGNYEYFYDVDGHFIFQEKKNYLNTNYSPIQKLDENGFLLSADNYYVDFNNTSEAIYTFEENNGLINSYSNTPNYTNIKNDFHIWGKNNDGYAIHYHVAIKDKPIISQIPRKVVDIIENGAATGKIRLAESGEIGYDYIPADWRAELYLQGLELKSLGKRPDVFQQEILDMFDSIYNMKEKSYKSDLINHPNDLAYWVDFIMPSEICDLSVDDIGLKSYSYQQDNIKRLYNTDVPNVIMINVNTDVIRKSTIINKCRNEGQPYANVEDSIYKSLAIGTLGYAAQEVARNLLYESTDYLSAISLNAIPIYYLEPNRRIKVYDAASGISGDYNLQSINLNLNPTSQMSITATKALNRL